MSSVKYFNITKLAMYILGLALAIMAVYQLNLNLQRRPSSKLALPSYGEVANFNLTESGGGTFARQDLKGKAWLVNFIFTRCPGMCPTMSLQFQMIGKTLPKNVNLLSVSVDPEYDTPQILEEYAHKYRLENGSWYFLTGPKNDVNELIKSFHIGTDDDPNAHSLRFVLIDDKAQIRGYYDSTEADVIRKIKEDISKLT